LGLTPIRCISSTWPKKIFEVPNSMVWLGCSSTTTNSLNVSSDDGVAGDALRADEEEDITTYCRRRRVVCLIQARSPAQNEQRGQASKCKNLGFLQRKLKQAADSAEVGFYRRRATPRETRSPTVTRPSIVTFQKPPWDHFERGQRFHHLTVVFSTS
jgi:hypothetical protein